MSGAAQGPATKLATSGTSPVDIAAAPPPSPGQVLTAVSPTAALWIQPPTGGGSSGNAAEALRIPNQDDTSTDCPLGSVESGQALVRSGDEIIGLTIAGAAITSPQNWYVSSDGSDANDGLSALNAWQTIDRVMQEIAGREIQADCVVHLVDQGPFEMPRLVLRAAANGMLQFRGDLSLKTVGVTAAFQGSIDADGNISTDLLGLADNACAGWFGRVTSGSRTGMEFQIAGHAEASIQILNTNYFTGVAQGDQFELFVPTAELSFDTNQEIIDCQGGAVATWYGNLTPALMFRHVRINCSNWIHVQNSCVGFSAVHCVTEIDMFGASTSARMGGFDSPSRYGVTSGYNYQISAAGMLFDLADGMGLIADQGVTLVATVVADYCYFGDASACSVTFAGARFESDFWFTSGDCYFQNDGPAVFNTPMIIGDRARVSSYARMIFDVSTDDAIQIFGGQFSGRGTLMSGGATSAGKVAVRCTVGKFLVADTFAMTGGTANQDIIVGSLPAAAASSLTAGSPIFDSTNGSLAYVDTSFLLRAALPTRTSGKGRRAIPGGTP